MNTVKELSKRLGELEAASPNKTAHTSVMERIAQYEKFFTLVGSQEFAALSEPECMEKLRLEGFDADFVGKALQYVRYLEGE